MGSDTNPSVFLGEVIPSTACRMDCEMVTGQLCRKIILEVPGRGEGGGKR